MIEPVSPIQPIPYMGRDQARNRLKYAHGKIRREKEKKEWEKFQSDYWEERKGKQPCR
jgi:hypothetical protein